MLLFYTSRASYYYVETKSTANINLEEIVVFWVHYKSGERGTVMWRSCGGAKEQVTNVQN